MSEAVCDILRYHGYQIDAVGDGEHALSYALAGQYDGLILDIMMPCVDGLTVLRRLRAAGINTPVLLLTARGEVEDRIAGLELGADDYLPKPFAMGELTARVKAMLRRRETYVPDQIKCGGLTLDGGGKCLAGPGGCFVLSRIEYQLMELLMLNKGVCFSSEQLLERVWGYETEAELGVVWVYISNLRKKLAALGADCELVTRRGVGYSLEVKA